VPNSTGSLSAASKATSWPGRMLNWLAVSNSSSLARQLASFSAGALTALILVLNAP
jgi:hypothetical protein